MKTNWKDTIAVFSVVLSLAFVAYELRQNSNLMRGQARQSLAELNQEWLALMSQDSTFNSIWTKAWITEEALTPSEERRATFMMLLNIRRMENVYFQYHEGLVDESALHSYGIQGKIFKNKKVRFQKFWAEWKPAFDPSFVEFMESR